MSQWISCEAKRMVGLLSTRWGYILISRTCWQYCDLMMSKWIIAIARQTSCDQSRKYLSFGMAIYRKHMYLVHAWQCMNSSSLLRPLSVPPVYSIQTREVWHQDLGHLWQWQQLCLETWTLDKQGGRQSSNCAAGRECSPEAHVRDHEVRQEYNLWQLCH